MGWSLLILELSASPTGIMAKQRTKAQRDQDGNSKNGTRAVDRVPRGLYSGNTAVMRYGAPSITPVTNGNIRVRHREQIFIVSSGASTGWITLAIGLNPSDANYFPWLKSIANNYVKYRWHSLSARYCSVSTTLQGGEVRMGTLYDHTELTKWGVLPTAAAKAASIISMNSSVVAPAYGTTMPNGVGVSWDCRQVHSRTPWLLTTGNDSTITEASDNQRVGAYFAFMAYMDEPNNTIGYVIVDYDIELTQVTYGGVAGDGTVVPPSLADSECQLTDWQKYINQQRKAAGLPELDCHGMEIPPRKPPSSDTGDNVLLVA